MTKRVSLKDIAKEVGVSVALVSYVVSGKEKEKKVGKELAEKIKKTAKEMGYKPNKLAQSLRQGYSKTIGVILADISNPFSAHLARAIEDEATKLGYSVLFGSSDEDKNKLSSVIETMDNRQVDGFIIAPAEDSEEIILNKINSPLVFIDRYFKDTKVSHVVVDNYHACLEATDYVISCGHSRIGLVIFKSDLIHMTERARGYSDSMKNHGLEDNIFIESVSRRNLQEDMDKSINKMTNSDNPCQAIIFCTNSISLAGLRSISKLKLKIPKQIGILCFDENDAFDFMQPKISYVKQPVEMIARESVKVLIDEITNFNKVVHVQIPSELIIRESC